MLALKILMTFNIDFLNMISNEINILFHPVIKSVCKSTEQAHEHIILYCRTFSNYLEIYFIKMIKKNNRNEKGGIENG